MGKLETEMSRVLVSVILPAYNAQEYLNIAIDSILTQTYDNIELIIINDGSTDNTDSVIKNYKDKRIRYFTQRNTGLANTLNIAVSQARGKYVARMDADDISHPERLKKQLAYLEKNKHIAMVGTSFDLINQDGVKIDVSYHLSQPEDVSVEFLVRNPFGHGTIMIRKKVLKESGGYDPTQPVEDYELWQRIAKHYAVANLPEVLYSWRVVETGISHGKPDIRIKQIRTLLQEIWSQSSLPWLSYPRIRKSRKHYTNQGEKYLEQYLYMLAALCVALYKQKKYLHAVSLLINILLIFKSVRPVREMLNTPNTHNYIVSILDIKNRPQNSRVSMTDLY